MISQYQYSPDLECQQILSFTIPLEISQVLAVVGIATHFYGEALLGECDIQPEASPRHGTRVLPDSLPRKGTHHMPPEFFLVGGALNGAVANSGGSGRPFATGVADEAGCDGFCRCQPWRAKRRLVVPSSREAALFSRRALRQRENKVGLRTRRPVIGRQVRSSNELAKLLRSAW